MISISKSDAVHVGARRAPAHGRRGRVGVPAAFAATLALFSLAGPAHAAPTGAIGRWLVAEKDGTIEIAPCGQSVCGRLVAAPNGAGRTDEKNPDPTLRARPVIGITMLQGFRRTETGWADGTIYDPKSGRTYRAELTPRADGTLALKGCVRGTPFCRTEVWTRAQ